MEYQDQMKKKKHKRKSRLSLHRILHGQMISEKCGLNYSVVMNWINRKLSFALNQCVIMCIRGSRTTHDPQTNNDIEIAETIYTTK